MRIEVSHSLELPRISYMKRTFPSDYPHLWLAKLNLNGAWTFEVIDSPGSLRYASLCVDSEDHCHISHEELGSS